MGVKKYTYFFVDIKHIIIPKISKVLFYIIRMVTINT